EEAHGRPKPMGADPERITIVEPVKLKIYREDVPTDTPTYVCVANLELESDAGPITTSRRPAWRVAAIDLVRARTPGSEPARPAGTPLPPGPKGLPGR